MQQDDILFSVHGQVGLVEMNRPKALNALSYDMAVALRQALAAWAADDGVTHVVLASSQPRAFCAGGDVRDLHAVAARPLGAATRTRARRRRNHPRSPSPTRTPSP